MKEQRKILAINGSYRAGGVTDQAVSGVLDDLKALDVDVEHVDGVAGEAVAALRIGSEAVEGTAVGGAFEAVETAAEGSHPQGAAAVLVERRNRVVGEAPVAIGIVPVVPPCSCLPCHSPESMRSIVRRPPLLLSASPRRSSRPAPRRPRDARQARLTRSSSVPTDVTAAGRLYMVFGDPDRPGAVGGRLAPETARQLG